MEKIINELVKKIEKVTIIGMNEENEYNLKDEIEDAIDENENVIEFSINYLEKVRINIDTLEVKNISEFKIDDIKKAYAIQDCSGYSLYEIMNKNGGQYYNQKIIDKYSFYDDMTKDQIIQEWIENGSDFTFEELEYEFDSRVLGTVFGFIEENA